MILKYETRDGKGNDIVKDIPLKEFKITDFEKEKTCAVCGTKIKSGVRIKDAVSGHFTDWNYFDKAGAQVCGRFTFYPENKTEKAFFNKVSKDFSIKSREFIIKNKIDMNFIGMCKHESRARKIMLSVKSAKYRVKTGEIRCCILADLTPADIWAYIISNNLPYLSVYDYPYLNRERIRNECTMCYNSIIIENGMLNHYRKMYPEYIAAVEKRWGRIG